MTLDEQIEMAQNNVLSASEAFGMMPAEEAEKAYQSAQAELRVLMDQKQNNTVDILAIEEDVAHSDDAPELSHSAALVALGNAIMSNWKPWRP